MNFLLLTFFGVLISINSFPCDTSTISNYCIDNGVYCVNVPLPNGTEISTPVCSRCKEGYTLSLFSNFTLNCLDSNTSACSKIPGCRLCVENGLELPISGNCLLCTQGLKSVNGRCVDNGECPINSDSCINMDLSYLGHIKAPLHCYSSKTLIIDYEKIMNKSDFIKPDDLNNLIYCQENTNRCMVTLKVDGKNKCINCHLNYKWSNEGEECRLIEGIIDDGDNISTNHLTWLIILIIILFLISLGIIIGVWYYKKKKNVIASNLEYFNADKINDN